MELAAAVDDGDVVNLVEHLVIDDPLEEVARHEAAIERGVDADEPVFDGVAAHLDARPAAAPAAARPPGDARIDQSVEVLVVEVVEDLLEVIDFAQGLKGERRGT